VVLVLVVQKVVRPEMDEMIDDNNTT